MNWKGTREIFWERADNLSVTEFTCGIIVWRTTTVDNGRGGRGTTLPFLPIALILLCVAYFSATVLLRLELTNDAHVVTRYIVRCNSRRVIGTFHRFLEYLIGLSLASIYARSPFEWYPYANVSVSVSVMREYPECHDRAVEGTEDVGCRMRAAVHRAVTGVPNHLLCRILPILTGVSRSCWE